MELLSFEDIYAKYIDAAKVLHDGDEGYIPPVGGVYIVRTPSDFAIELLKEPDGTRIVKGKELPNEYEEFKHKYDRLVSNKADLTVLYYGSSNNIKRRIKEYVKFGYGYKDTNGKEFDKHAGGKGIWYIKDNKKLLVEFYPIKNYRQEEAYLIAKYYRQYKELPFANEKRGDNQ